MIKNSGIKSRLLPFFELIYVNVHNIKKRSLNWIISFVVAAASTLPFELIFDVKSLLKYIFVEPNLAMVLMWICSIVVVAVYILDRSIVRYIQKNNDFSQLEEIMRESADSGCFDMSKYNSGFIWGQDRTILVCSNIIEGYTTRQIYLDCADSDKYYRFPESCHECSEDLNLLYNDFEKSDPAVVKSISQNNNNDKWMLSGIYKTFNKSDCRIYLNVQKTKWSMNRFVWYHMFPNKYINKQKALSAVADDYTKGYYPNSLCLHLVVVTADRKVVINRISGINSNDYPYSIAATIGEQLEAADFNNQTDYHNRFVDKWIERAFKEEFGLTEINYNRIVDVDSARILAFVEEGDIYNFSVVATVALNYTFDDFRKYISVAPVTDKEFTDPDYIDISCIPGELCHHFVHHKGADNGNYHPSTAMRLFLVYAHYYGICRFKNEYVKSMRSLKIG